MKKQLLILFFGVLFFSAKGQGCESELSKIVNIKNIHYLLNNSEIENDNFLKGLGFNKSIGGLFEKTYLYEPEKCQLISIRRESSDYELLFGEPRKECNFVQYSFHIKSHYSFFDDLKRNGYFAIQDNMVWYSYETGFVITVSEEFWTKENSNESGSNFFIVAYNQYNISDDKYDVYWKKTSDNNNNYKYILFNDENYYLKFDKTKIVKSGNKFKVWIIEEPNVCDYNKWNTEQKKIYNTSNDIANIKRLVLLDFNNRQYDIINVCAYAIDGIPIANSCFSISEYDVDMQDIIPETIIEIVFDKVKKEIN